MLSLSQATGILVSFAVPVLAGKKRDQRNIVLVLIVIEAIALEGLLFPQLGWVALWVSLIGFVLGGTFGLALLFLVLRSQDAEDATELSGMAQSIGYIIAATGPVIFGSIFDLTFDWIYPLLFLFLVATVKLFMGLGAGRPEKV